MNNESVEKVVGEVVEDTVEKFNPDDFQMISVEYDIKPASIVKTVAVTTAAGIVATFATIGIVKGIEWTADKIRTAVQKHKEKKAQKEVIDDSEIEE